VRTIPNERRSITATEAQQHLGIPTGTTRAWAAAGKLHAVSIGKDRQRWYLLSEILKLDEHRKARKQHKRPARCLTKPQPHIA
jgi:predicted site-specific integrase-resolvase